MTEPNSHRPVRVRQNEELDRAMLVDRIALLERQLESAEKRVRIAEEGTRHAKSALAAALLTKARHQKREPGPDDRHSNDALQQRDASEVGDDAAAALRQEYEQRFCTARERLAQEFQQRLNNAKAAWEADAARQPRHVPADGFNLMPGRLLPFLKNEPGSGQSVQKLAFSLPVAFRGMLRSPTHKAAVLMLAVAAGGGAFLGWSAMTGKRMPSEPAPSVATAPSPSDFATPAPVTPGPVASAPLPVQAAPAHPLAADMPAPEASPDGADKAQASDALPEPTGPAHAVHGPVPDPVEQHPVMPQANTPALQEELSVLRERLNAATKRARLAEETLRIERRKTAAAQTLRVPNAIREPEPALPRVAAPAQVPGQESDVGSAPDRSSRPFQPAE